MSVAKRVADEMDGERTLNPLIMFMHAHDYCTSPAVQSNLGGRSVTRYVLKT